LFLLKGGNYVVGMEGWLFLIESNRLMMKYPRKRYFILTGNRASFYKEKPAQNEVSLFLKNLSIFTKPTKFMGAQNKSSKQIQMLRPETAD
jgi:hypothetical protein